MSGAQKAEIAILGGGPSGGVLALLATELGWKTVLIDSREENTPHLPDSRAFAIVRGGWRVLKAAGVAQLLEADAQQLNGMEANDLSNSGHIDGRAVFGLEDLRNDDHAPGLGFMVEVDQLLKAIDTRLNEAAIDHFASARFASLETTPNKAVLNLESGDRIEADLVIGADGVGSIIREALGIRTHGWSYGQSVFAVTVGLNKPHDGIARQWFQPEGPFAMLPLKGNRGNVAWFRSSGASEAMLKLSTQDVEAELNAQFAHLVGEMTLERDPLAYPLQLRFADSMVGQRVALVGDAVRRLHPLAGQGFNLGLKDIAALLEVIEEGRSLGLRPGDGTGLEEYQKWRRFDGISTALAMDAINRTYSNDISLLKPIRRFALNAARQMPPIRRLLAEQASADQKHLPKLVQGLPLANVKPVPG